MQADCRDSVVRRSGLLAKRAREGGTAQPAISHARLPTKAAAPLLSTLSATSLPTAGILRLTIRTWTLQLLIRGAIHFVHTRNSFDFKILSVPVFNF